MITEETARNLCMTARDFNLADSLLRDGVGDRADAERYIAARREHQLAIERAEAEHDE